MIKVMSFKKWHRKQLDEPCPDCGGSIAPCPYCGGTEEGCLFCQNAEFCTTCMGSGKMTFKMWKEKYEAQKKIDAQMWLEYTGRKLNELVFK